VRIEWNAGRGLVAQGVRGNGGEEWGEAENDLGMQKRGKRQGEH